MDRLTTPTHPSWIAGMAALVAVVTIPLGYFDPMLLGLLTGVVVGAWTMHGEWKTYVNNLRKQNEI